MNIHPIFVHFPIALLTIYSIMEIFQFKRLRESHGWTIVKTTLLVLGTIGSYAAFQTGELVTEGHVLTGVVKTHSIFAQIVVQLFTVVMVIYAVRIINTEFQKVKDWLWNTKYIRTVWMVLSRISDFIFKQWWIFIIIGIAGVVLVSITGALGGSLVYGPDADPFVSFVYHLFF